MTIADLMRKECRERGYLYAKTEHWNHHARIRQDLFNCIDYLVLDNKPGVLGVQATTGSNAAARVTKCQETIPPEWFQAGNRLQVWSWAKRGPRGKRKVWTLKIHDVVRTPPP